MKIVVGHRVLIFQSIFPNLVPQSNWKRQAPIEPLCHFALDDIASFALKSTEPVPVLFGLPEIIWNDNQILCSADLFGGIFFMLAGFEEIVSKARDSHERFPASASIASREGFLHRPLADEYRMLILNMIKTLWPGFILPKVESTFKVSCDVDHPFDMSTRSLSAFLRTFGADIIKRQSFPLALKRFLNYTLGQFNGSRFDPYFNFDWYMRLCEEFGHTVTFYFISGQSAGAIDGYYRIREQRVLNLLKIISERGHKIGMHGSYNTFRDPARLKKERAELIEALENAGVASKVVDNRQHYLRWDAACTPDHLCSAGFQVDSTGGYADCPGFKFGTSQMFQMWSWQEMRPLKLYQKPLIAMEGSLLSPLYLGLNEIEAMELLRELRNKTQRYGGEFSLLWHNSTLVVKKERRIFSRCLSENSIGHH
ncbi:polysaccharide deacetylase family protein [Akkermansiaceae bacterium]|nr:polysaccharide deacetylase family protein [Akkermansiaceae bacterium]